MDKGGAPVKFDTFTGVFTPTLLTILGVILYVRLGWVVGNAGLMGAFGILALAIGITVCTGLSLSSIATNTRIGDGGPYAVIKRSLGLEVGASVGVPLYLSRPLGIAMYIFGFREGWRFLFPGHDPLIVDMVVFVTIFGLAYISADLSFRIQFLIMALIAFSLVMIVISPETTNPSAEINWWGNYPGFVETDFDGISFWGVFAVFFPATTGILAGANMSGDLRDPRRSIPVGTLWAIGVSAVVYFGVALWLSRVATPHELVTNYEVLLEKSFWAKGVLLGLLGATFSSALAGAVGGPRILMAMAENNLVPRSDWLARRTRRGEPRNAVALTALLTLGCVMFRDLNVIAPLVTMFFLITYLTINVVLLIESSLQLVSFRPTLRVPRIVPLLGSLGCLFCMFIINPTFGLVAVAMAVAIYIWVSSRHIVVESKDVRSSIFAAMAQWAAGKVEQLGAAKNVRAWKPNLLVPVHDASRLRGEFHFLCDVARPEGSLQLVGITADGEQAAMEEPLRALAHSFHEQGAFCRMSVVGAKSYVDAVVVGLESLQGAFFRPNVLYLTLSHDPSRRAAYAEIIAHARATGVGVMVLGRHPDADFGQREAINLYVQPDRSGWSVDEAFAHNNLNLTLLIGYRLMQRWHARLRLVTVIADEAERARADEFLAELQELARFPATTEKVVLVGAFADRVAAAPQADLSLLGLRREPDFDFIARVVTLSQSSCLFVADSGSESARD